jgi:glutathione S-transferase
MASVYLIGLLCCFAVVLYADDKNNTDSTTPHYKLTYFDARGRAEMSRLIFAQAGVEYEDVRVNKKDWPKLKPKMPFNQLPVLEIDGKILPQSKAIARYLARQYGLVGKTDIDAAFCDAYVDGLDDVANNMSALHDEKDKDKRKKLLSEFQETSLKPFLTRYENFLTDNGSGYFVGKQLTWADLTIYTFIEAHTSNHTELLDSHKKLQKFMQKVSDLPKIKTWLKKRPQTES